MTAAERSWTLRITAAAEADLREILAWTVQRFGTRQARVYASTVSAAIQALTAQVTSADVARIRPGEP